MASFTTEYRITTVEKLRKTIGDDKKKMYTDEELDSILRGRVFPSRTNERLNAILNHFYSFAPCPVLDLTITDGVAGNHYLIDETTKHVAFISGVAPGENASIEVQYLRVDFLGAVAEILTAIATDKVKLAVVAKTGNVSTDLTKLSDTLMLQAQALETINYWTNG